jgi:ABC-type glycerol-3-phosphate transport system permease component
MHLTSFERRNEPLLPRAAFLLRLGNNLLVALGLVFVSLLIGMVGYRATEGMAWLDAFLNAAMILSGMGPVGALQAPAAKFFAGCTALYSGLLLVITTGIVLAPVIHRVAHGLHVEDEDDEASAAKARTPARQKR